MWDLIVSVPDQCLFFYFTNLDFNNFTKIVLNLTLFIQRSDNLANLMGTRIILTFANN